MPDTETCSKISTEGVRCSNVLDTEGYPKWCKACRKTYRAAYDDMQLSRKERAGFAAGVRQTKEILAAEFDRLGSGNFSGYEIAALILQAPGPTLD